MVWNTRLAILCAAALAACAQATPGAAPGDSSLRNSPSTPRVSKSIAIGMDEDVRNLWDGITLGGGSGARELANLVNQHLVAITADGSPEPRLLAELPSLDRGTWRVLPDGRMETTWKLRPGVFWHDGVPFTPEDLVFSWRVNKDPEVPNSNQEAAKVMERVEEVDGSTVVATWSTLYPYADRLEHRELLTLPRHLVESSYVDNKESMLSSPYFSSQYVGLGPFRVAAWEPGSHIELAAFDAFFLGRAKLDSIRVQFITDRNTMLANLRARSLQSMLTLGGIPEFDALMSIKKEWEADRYGTMLVDPISYRFIEAQKFHNPQPADLIDPRVRLALMLAVDRPELARVVFDQEFGVVADSWIHPSFRQYAELQSAITRQPYDPRRATALLEEVGWRKGGDGVLEKGGQRFRLTMRDQEGERDPVIIAAGWKGLGIIGEYELRTAAMLRDRQDRATFTGVDVTSNPMGAASASRRFAGYNTPTAENRWTGTNRGGFASAAWDDLDRRILAALDDRTRLDLERDLLRVFSAELPALPLYFRWDVVPVGGNLTGVQANTGVAHRGFILHTWNAHEWDIGPSR